jgi:hypothetical protein
VTFLQQGLMATFQQIRSPSVGTTAELRQEHALIIARSALRHD